METADVVIKIVGAQERVIGPLAIEQAKKVPGLSIDWQSQKVTVSGDSKTVLGDLVKNYEHLFGQASVEVCKDAIRGIVDEIPKDQLPPVLSA